MVEHAGVIFRSSSYIPQHTAHVYSARHLFSSERSRLASASGSNTGPNDNPLNPGPLHNRPDLSALAPFRWHALAGSPMLPSRVGSLQNATGGYDDLGRFRRTSSGANNARRHIASPRPGLVTADQDRFRRSLDASGRIPPRSCPPSHQSAKRTAVATSGWPILAEGLWRTGPHLF